MDINKIYCWNCLDVLKEVGDWFVDLTVTSPPYDNLRTYEWYTFDFEWIANELYRVTKKWWVLVRIVNDATINWSETGTSFKQALYFKEIWFNLHDTMIWQKISPFTHKNRYIADFEYMFVLSKWTPKTANIIQDRKNKRWWTKVHWTLQQKEWELTKINWAGKRLVKEYWARYNIRDIPSEKNNKTGHPAVFPVQLAKDHIISWSNEWDIVLDPMCWSWTTCVASKQLGRNYIWIDISDKYVDIANSRLNELW